MVRTALRYNEAANALAPIARGTVDGKLGELHRLVTDVERRARHRKPRR